MRRRGGGLIACAAIFLLSGCARQAVNPSFAVSRADAKRAITEMERAPRGLDRPVVVLGGYHDPGVGPAAVCGRLRRVAGTQPVVGVSYFFDRTFDDCRRDVIAAVEKACPSADSRQTVEVDVVGLSMGGVVARYCATERPGEKRLRIRRLFTVSSPHRGSEAATAVPALSVLHRDLREGSAFLHRLELAEARESGAGAGPVYEIVPYVRLGDWMVGTRDAAPAGVTPWWVATPPLEDAHVGAPLDERILADIERRLRGEEPFTRPPAAAVPVKQ